MPPYCFKTWFFQNWSRVTPPMACALLAIAPILAGSLSVGLLLIFLQSPVYMLHQYEEHARGGFKKYCTETIGGGFEVLNDAAILFINLVFVWVLNLILFYASYWIDPRIGLASIYLSVLNGLSHVGIAASRREYNPGLWTSLALFLPLGLPSLWFLSRETGAGLGDHLAAVAAVVLLHAGIAVYAKSRLRQLRRAAPALAQLADLR